MARNSKPLEVLPVETRIALVLHGLRCSRRVTNALAGKVTEVCFGYSKGYLCKFLMCSDLNR
jgi:hypothetical protein